MSYWSHVEDTQHASNKMHWLTFNFSWKIPSVLFWRSAHIANFCAKSTKCTHIGGVMRNKRSVLLLKLPWHWAGSLNQLQWLMIIWDILRPWMRETVCSRVKGWQCEAGETDSLPPAGRLWTRRAPLCHYTQLAHFTPITIPSRVRRTPSRVQRTPVDLKITLISLVLTLSLLQHGPNLKATQNEFGD